MKRTTKGNAQRPMMISIILFKKTLYITTNKNNIIYYEGAYQVLSKQKNWGFSMFYLRNKIKWENKIKSNQAFESFHQEMIAK